MFVLCFQQGRGGQQDLFQNLSSRLRLAVGDVRREMEQQRVEMEASLHDYRQKYETSRKLSGESSQEMARLEEEKQQALGRAEQIESRAREALALKEQEIKE